MTEPDVARMFEREDVREAFTRHCAWPHADSDAVRLCTRCAALRATLTVAIVEWLAVSQPDQPVRLTREQFDHIAAGRFTIVDGDTAWQPKS